MVYREVSRMEYEEVVRRWQAGESQRAIARALGLARNTVAAYIRAASAEPATAGEAKPLPRRQPGPTMEQPGPAVAFLAPPPQSPHQSLRTRHRTPSRVGSWCAPASAGPTWTASCGALTVTAAGTWPSPATCGRSRRKGSTWSRSASRPTRS